jgi:hypothetical protein
MKTPRAKKPIRQENSGRKRPKSSDIERTGHHDKDNQPPEALSPNKSKSYATRNVGPRGNSNMTNTLSIQERLTEISVVLPELQRAADAEVAFVAQCAHGGPWAGSSKRLDDLQCEARDLKLQLRGMELSTALDQLKALDKELLTLQGERNARDQHLRTLAESETVKKWLAAAKLAIKHGYGFSWQMYSDFYVSGKPFRLGATPDSVTSAAAFFATSACPAGLKFTESDRETVCRWTQAGDDADRAVTAWQDCCDRRSRLLLAHPELKAAS